MSESTTYCNDVIACTVSAITYSRICEGWVSTIGGAGGAVGEGKKEKIKKRE